MGFLAIIPARGGSKGLPNKNLALLRGRPLIWYSIRAAQDSGVFDRCVVTTDSAAIANYSRAQGIEVIDRPAEFATDSALLWGAINHVLDSLTSYKPEKFMLLQPTSPLRNAKHIEAASGLWSESSALSVVSVMPSGQHPHKSVKIVGDYLEPFTRVEDLSSPRQQLPKIYMQNGAIYGVQTAVYRREQRLFIQPALPYIMPAEESVDIDNPIDLVVCEALLSRR